MGAPSAAKRTLGPLAFMTGTFQGSLFKQGILGPKQRNKRPGETSEKKGATCVPLQLRSSVWGCGAVTLSQLHSPELTNVTPEGVSLDWPLGGSGVERLPLAQVVILGS